MKLLFVLLMSMSISFGQAVSDEIRTLNKQLDSIEKAKTVLIQKKEVLQLEWIQDEIVSVGLPKRNQNEEIIEHSAMMLSYNEDHEQANWVMHVILPAIINGNVSRSNDFREDPKVKSGTAQEKDYFIKKLKSDGINYTYDGFGYDRGHLAPSADFRWSRKALSESYFYSNMSPQLGDFNREKWARLENWMREYVVENEVSLIVVTAPILNDKLRKIERSPNGLSIPDFYLKAAFDKKNNRAIAFVMPNKKLERPIESYAVSIDSAEALIDYDLFSKVDDSLEAGIEAKCDYQLWLPSNQKNDVKAIDRNRLPKNALSTYSIHVFVNDGKKHTVCGKVVSTKKHDKGHVFINLDKQFPNQIFSISIFESSIKNFNYEPEIYLMNKEVCFTAEIGEYKKTPSMVIDNGKQVKLLDNFKLK